MKIPFFALQQFIDLPESPEKVGDILTSIGIEVDAISSSASFKGVVAAEIVSTASHPNADKLTVTTVFDGTSTFQVVCGASNCRPKMRVALARLGARIGTSEIKPVTMRGVDSQGMLCAGSELGLQETPGIMELSSDIPLGKDLVSALNFEPIIEVSLTPNLGHCLSLYGIAKELGAVLGREVKPVDYTFSGAQKTPINVKIENPDLATSYSTLLIEGIEAKESPEWLKTFLEKVGIASINLPVDIGNYVMVLLGQPMHVFDFDTLKGNALYINNKPKQLNFMALGEKNLTLPQECLVIADSEKVLALAGIIGGLSSSVTATTTRILLESAHFAPETIQKTSRKLGVHTDSSHRFERGIDGERTIEALELAASLIAKEFPEANVYLPQTVHGNRPPKRTIPLRIHRLHDIIGLALSGGEIREILERAQMEVKEKNEHVLLVTVPSSRNDLHQEIDLLEEIARYYGLDNLPEGDLRFSTSTVSHTPQYLFENKIRSILLSEGLQEWITCDLTSPEHASLTAEHLLGQDSILTVRHPSSRDHSVLRTTLLSSMLPCVQKNGLQQIHNLRAFEIGNIHFKNNNNIVEQTMVGILLTGMRTSEHWSGKPVLSDFFDLKGIAENLLECLGIKNIEFTPSDLDTFHPYRQANIIQDGISIGVIGALHPKHVDSLDIKHPVYFATFNLWHLMNREIEKQFIELPKFPASERDETRKFRIDTPSSAILAAVAGAKETLLEKVHVHDIYLYEKEGEKYKNLTLRFRYRDHKKTVEQSQVDTAHAKIMQEVAEKFPDCIL